MKVIPLHLEHTGAAIAMTVGDRLRIDLEENPTTGYRWQAPPQTALLRLIEDGNAPHAGAEIGGGGARTLVYEARAPGSGSLELQLRRAWELGVEPSRTFAVALQVSDETSSPTSEAS